MSITRASILTAVGYTYKYALTIKQAETYEAIQYICDDIAGVFDGFRGLQDYTENIPVTQDTAKVDISTYLLGLRHERISQISIVDTANHDNDRTLDEKDYLKHYLKLVPDPDNPSAASRFDVPEVYARYGDYIYLYPVPDLTTLELIIYFDKVHPTLSASVDILYPSDFKQLIVNGVLGVLYDMSERKDGMPNDRMEKYYAMRQDKLDQYAKKPNLRRRMKCRWGGR